jgi:hypothetical protein
MSSLATPDTKIASRQRLFVLRLPRAGKKRSVDLPLPSIPCAEHELTRNAAQPPALKLSAACRAFGPVSGDRIVAAGRLAARAVPVALPHACTSCKRGARRGGDALRVAAVLTARAWQARPHLPLIRAEIAPRLSLSPIDTRL